MIKNEYVYIDFGDCQELLKSIPDESVTLCFYVLGVA